MKIYRNLKLAILTVSCILALSSCGSSSSGGGSDTIPAPGEITFAAQALENISALDFAGLGLNNPPGYQPMMARPLTSTSSAVQTQDLPPGDPRWLWAFHPLRPRGRDDNLPAITDPLAAARYVLTTQPSCATVTNVGTCPPDPSVVGSSCTSTIVFDQGGCTVSASVGNNQMALFLSGTLVHTVTIVQAGVWPAIQGIVQVSTTDFRVTEPAGAFMDYRGTVIENFDGTAPVGGFTVLHVSPGQDPMTFSGPDGFQVTVEGQRAIVVMPRCRSVLSPTA